ncbi:MULTISPECIES: fumarylacetoacetate hydrolase family protein [unclassified Thermoactinomyces]|uniref:fumarylacetoacetate hydrolase family protein n=1 Tax=Thermoactinomyces TaxID=2023 RepID=UPI00051A2DA5
MKLVTYKVKEDDLNIHTRDDAGARFGWIIGRHVVDVGFAQKWLEVEKGVSLPYELATDLLSCLKRGEGELVLLKELDRLIRLQPLERLFVEGEPVTIPLQEVKLFSPLPVPPSVRDFYAFEQHVKTCRARRGLDMVPEWYQIPVFYFSNHHAVVGHQDVVKKPSYTHCLDFELEIACIIGKKGKNIARDKALEYIAGFTIMNDWSARDAQRQEMAVGLGPAKGKDFATSLGPYLVTLDELEDRRQGERWDLQMTARINGREVSRGNVKDLYWTFAQMIERASSECVLAPGDVIGSGTVGTGCILELGEEVHRWLEPGDQVELEIERLGVLKNEII